MDAADVMPTDLLGRAKWHFEKFAMPFFYDSLFKSQLNGSNPKEKFVFFFVYPDSIKAFEAARDIANQMHFETGWGDLPQGQPLTFGSGGRAMGAQ